MCKDRRLIITRSGKRMFVDCGKCESCSQKKASRNARLIRNNNVTHPDFVHLFVTLTYSNSFIPYIRKSEFCLNVELNKFVVPLYRDKEVRKVRVLDDNNNMVYRFKARKGGFIRNLEFSGDLDFSLVESLSSIARMYDKDKVAVLNYKDLQDFIKRLNSNLLRKYDTVPCYDWFACGEYGPKTKRPHFHLLLRIPKNLEKVYRSAIVESWRFSDIARLQKYIEVAVDGSSYVASYVNSHSYLSEIYRSKEVAPKSTHSKFYGFNRSDFSLDKVLECADKHDFSFSYNILVKDTSISFGSTIPRYVIAHWFPKIQGFSKLSTSELIQVYSNPKRLAKYARRLGYHDTTIKDSDIYKRYESCDCDVFGLSDIEYINFIKNEEKCVKKHSLFYNIGLLYRARKRYIDTLFGNSDFDKQDALSWYVYSESFAFDALKVWDSYNSCMLKKMYDIPLKSRYENIDDFVVKPSISQNLRDYVVNNNIRYSSYFEVDVNNNTYNNNIHDWYVLRYKQLDKSKKINNAVYSAYDYQF